MWRRSLLPAAIAVVVSAALLAASAGAAVPSWTTYRHDGARSGVDPDSTQPVTPSQAWQTSALDGEVYAQPLVYGSFVYVATENDTIYKLDAATGAVVWSQHLATPEPSSVAPCGDITPSIGITSTPVLDPSTSRIYAVGAVSASGAIHHELFALDLRSGQPLAGFPVTVDPPYPAGGAAVNQLQRPGLALDAGRILIGYGGNDGDCNTYWGWLVSAPTDGSGALDAFQVDVGATEGAIWGGGNAPPVDAAGNVYIATGNGTSSPDPDYGDSIVKLKASASALDWWAPTNWQSLDTSDADLGSSMPTLLPGGYLFQSGKDGNGYLLNGAALGHIAAPARQASGFCGGLSFGGGVYDPAGATIYAACTNGLKALSLGSGSPPSLSGKAGFSAPSDATGPPMIAGGLVWVTSHASGTLYGLDPVTGAQRHSFSIPEHGSDVNHFATASAGNGRLFVASGDQVTAFTIAQTPPPTATTTALASSATPAAIGTAVTLTASVSPGPDDGTVTFADGGVALPGCSGVAAGASAGSVTCRAVFARTGAHTLTATYSGDTFYLGSTSAGFTQTVTAAGDVRLTVSHVAITPRRFRAAHGTKMRVRLSTAATVIIAITALRRGHVVGHRCSTTRRRGRSCRARVRLARLHYRGRAGQNTFTMKVRRFAPGDYAAFISAADRAGHHSQSLHVAFTILRARAHR